MIMGPVENIYPLRAYDAFDRPPAEANKGFDQFDDISF